MSKISNFLESCVISSSWYIIFSLKFQFIISHHLNCIYQPIIMYYRLVVFPKMYDNILLSVPNVNSLVQKNSTHRNPIIFRKLSNNENFKLHRFLDLRSKCLYSSINYMISYVTYGLNARLIQKYTKYGYISSNTRGRDSGAI